MLSFLLYSFSTSLSPEKRKMGKALTLIVSMLVPRASVEAFWVVGDLVPLPYAGKSVWTGLDRPRPVQTARVCKKIVPDRRSTSS